MSKVLSVRLALAAMFCVGLVLGPITAVPARAQTFTILDDFLTGGPGPEWAGGPLAQGRDGDLYGYSYLGGSADHGSIWKTTPAGTVSIIYSFAAGNDCQNGMTLGTDGNFYGTALTNCAGDGYVFKLTPGGTLTVLHTFTGTPDGNNAGLLTQYTDGNFYGVTTLGGANNLGSVFKITPAGTLTTLYSFAGNGPANPTYGLTVGNDGNFYGTFSGNSGWRGGIFKMTPAGAVTILHAFFDTPDGANPSSGLTLGKDGNFYGNTEFGGTVYDGRDYEGTIFKMTPAGTVTILHSFNAATDYAAYPTAPLVQATDGNFYGVISGCAEFGCTGGPNDIYKVTPGGTLTVLEKFTGPNGSYPYWPLTQDTNGTIYGLAQQGGTVNGGVLFTVNIGAKAFINLVSTSGKVSSNIGILGRGFSASSVVKFNGVKATTVTRTGSTFLLATVPAGANDGYVTVTTGTTTLTSSQKFTVHDSWSTGTVMPTARFGAFTGAIGNNIYVIGGATNSGYQVTNVNEIYSTQANKWTTGAPDPTSRELGASAVVNGILYVIGGSTGGSNALALVEAYDPVSNTWTTKSPMPAARNSMPAVVDKNIIYVIGGYDPNTGVFYDNVESYNPATDTWTAEAPLPVATAWEAVGLLGSTIVAADGQTGPSGTIVGSTEGYNVATNTWSTLTADPTPRLEACFAAINGELYVAGGANATHVLGTNAGYNSTTKAWKTLTSMPNALATPGSATVGGRLYCFGGASSNLSSVYNFVQIYQP